MANFSKLLSLINAKSTTVDFSLPSNILELGGGGIQFDGSTSGHVVIAASAITSTYSLVWPAAQAASSGYVLSNDGTGVLSWVNGSSGSVTSVALSLPSIFAVSGSPVTSSGTLSATFNNQSANTFFAGPGTGSAATPTFRSIVAADIPTLNQNTTGTAANVTASSNATLTTLSALTTASSLASVGTITSGVWNGTTIAIANGGTGQTTASSAFAALSPMTTAGDLIYENATPAPDRLAIGSDGQVLTVVSGLPAWVDPSTSGTVTSVAFADASSTPIYSISGSPVTSSGTLTQTLTTQSANRVFAGPSTGSAAQPTFRALVSADVPDLSAVYVTQTEVGAANGVASLDGSGKVPLSQLPSSVMEYKGAWDASSNTPTLADGTGVSGYVYRVSVAGTQNLGSGSVIYYVGDFVIYNGSIWQRSPMADGVISVNGATGVVTVNAINQLTGDVTAGPASGSASAASTVAKIQGTTVSGTTGTGNVAFSASPTFTGTLSAAAISASSTVTGSNLSGTNTGDQTITLTGDVTGSGTGSFAATIAAAAVTASKLNTSAFDQTTITGGGGSAATVVNAPALKRTLVAGQTFTANTSYAVRWGVTANGETANRVYAADITTSSFDLFYVIGMASSAAGVSAGGNISVTTLGSFALSSADTAFASGTDGAPVFLTANGTFSVTPPSSAGQALTRIGIVQVRSGTAASNFIDVMPQFVAVN